MTDIIVRWLVPPGPAAAATLGRPGPTWPQQLYAAGLIAAPTNQAAAAFLAAGWVTVNADMIATSGQLLSIDTTAGAVNITLPAGGGFVAMRDASGTWGTHNVIVHGNGALIAGDPTMTLDVSGFRVDFNEIAGAWRFTPSFLIGA